MAKVNRDILEFLFVGPLFSIFKVLNQIRRDTKNMATQDQIDALTAKVGEVGNTLNKVKKEVQDLKGKASESQPPLDLSGLEAAVEEATGKLKEVDDVVPDATEEPSTPPGQGGTPPGQEEAPATGEPTPEDPNAGQAFDADGNPIQ